MEIRKKINISLKDYFLFNVSLMKKNIITYMIMLLVMCFAFVFVMYEDKPNTINFWTNSLIFYAIGLVFLLLYFGLITFFASKKAFTPNKKYYENMEIVINDQGVYQYSEGAESGITYDKVYKIKDNFLFFVVLVSPRQGIILPKKAFTKEEIVEVKQLFKK